MGVSDVKGAIVNPQVRSLLALASGSWFPTGREAGGLVVGVSDMLLHAYFLVLSRRARDPADRHRPHWGMCYAQRAAIAAHASKSLCIGSHACVRYRPSILGRPGASASCDRL